MLLYKAITFRSTKRRLILGAMLLFVMMSLFMLVSLTQFKDVIAHKVSKQNLAHTTIEYDVLELVDADDTTHFVSSTDAIKKKIEEGTYPGITYSDTGFFAGLHFDIEVAHPESPFVVVEGKPLIELKDHEVAITKHHHQMNPIGSQITTDEYDQPLTVVSIVDYPYYDLIYNPIEAFQGIELLQESLNQRLFVNKSFFKAIEPLMIQSVETMRAEALMIERPELIEKVKNNFQIDEQDPLFMDIFVGMNQLYLRPKELLKLHYDSFSYAYEDDILSSFMMGKRLNPVDDFGEDDFRYIESMGLLARSSPMPQQMQKTLALFVVSGIVLSSLYGFYIHLQNQCIATKQELAGFHLIGISFKNIVRAYLKFFLSFTIPAIVLFAGSVWVLGSVNDTYFATPKTIGMTLLISIIFYLIVSTVFIFQLKSITKDAKQVVAFKGSSLVKRKQMNQSNLVRVLTLERYSKQISLSIGFSLSLTLSILMVILSFSALISISNVYDKSTLGVSFDYIVVKPTWEVFEALEAQTQYVAQVDKERRVMYINYEIDIPISDVTVGTNINFYDTMEGFIEVYQGQLTPPGSEFKGLNQYSAVEALTSKRVADLKSLNTVYTKERVPASSKYLFSKSSTLGYERAFRVHGKVSTLMDRGFVAFKMNKLSRLMQSLGKRPMKDALVILGDAISHETFQDFVKTHQLRTISYEEVMQQFKVLNESLNKQSIDTLWIVFGAMLLQAAINISGLLVQINEDRRKEDQRMTHIGVKSRLLKQVNQANTTVRFWVTTVFLLFGVALLLPIFNKALMNAFAIHVLPVNLTSVILVSIGLIIILMVPVLAYFVKPNKEH